MKRLSSGIIILSLEIHLKLNRFTNPWDSTMAQYQALGIVLSEAILKRQLHAQNGPLSKGEIISIYKSSLRHYSSIFPSLRYNTLTEGQRSALNRLTNLACNGVIDDFVELENSLVG